jgi:hypothetical protein
MTAILRLATLNGVAADQPNVLHPDAKLLALQARMRKACDRLIENPDLAARGVVSEIANAMAVIPARTIEAFQIKGKAMRWSYFGDEYFEPMDFQTANGRLFVSLLHDLKAFNS